MKVQEIKIELRVVVTLPERNAHYTAADIADLVREDIEGIQNGTMRVQMVSVDNATEVQPEQ